MFYRSERLFLRPAFPEDAREIYDGICDAGVVQMLASVPWPYRPADAEEYCALPHDPQAPIRGPRASAPIRTHRLPGPATTARRPLQGREQPVGRYLFRGPAARDGLAAPTGCGDCRYSLPSGPDDRPGSGGLDNPSDASGG